MTRPPIIRRLAAVLALAAATVLTLIGIAGCTVPGQPDAITFAGCGNAYWPPERVCWFTAQPTGEGLATRAGRVTFQLRTPTVVGLTVNGAAVPLNVPAGTIPPVAASAYEVEPWPYDVVAAPGQVAHLVGSAVTLALPDSVLVEGAGFTVVVTYRGWEAGDTALTAEVSRQFRWTAQDPARCRPQVSGPSTTTVGESITTSWSAPGCKQAALTRVNGNVAGPAGPPPTPPLGAPQTDALAEAYSMDAAAAPLSGSVTLPIDHTLVVYRITAWAWDGSRHSETLRVTATPPASPPPSTAPPAQTYAYCATGPNGSVQLYVTATSEAAAKAEAEATYAGAGWSVSAGYCTPQPFPVSTPSTSSASSPSSSPT